MIAPRIECAIDASADAIRSRSACSVVADDAAARGQRDSEVDPLNVGLEAAVPRVLYFQEFTVIGTATTGLEPVALDIPTHDVVAPTCEGGIGRPYLLEASNTWAASPLPVTSNIFITTNVPV